MSITFSISSVYASSRTDSPPPLSPQPRSLSQSHQTEWPGDLSKLDPGAQQILTGTPDEVYDRLMNDFITDPYGNKDSLLNMALHVTINPNGKDFLEAQEIEERKSAARDALQHLISQLSPEKAKLLNDRLEERLQDMRLQDKQAKYGASRY